MFLRRLARVWYGGAIEVITWGSRISLIAIMVLVTSDVIMRKFFRASVIGAHEIVAASLVVIVFLALAYTESRGDHVRVKFVTERFGYKTQLVMEAIMTLVMIAFFSIMIWQTTLYAVDALKVGLTYETIGWPIFPFRLVVPIGTLFFVLQLLPRLISSLSRLSGARGQQG